MSDNIQNPSPLRLASDTDAFDLALQDRVAEDQAQAMNLARTAGSETLYEHVELFARLEPGVWAQAKEAIRHRLGLPFSIQDFSRAVSDRRSNMTVPMAQTERSFCLTPGEHVTDIRVRIEIGADDFADAVLEQLPEGAVYRRESVVVEAVGEPGERAFQTVTPDRLRLKIDHHAPCGQWRSASTTGKAPPRLTMVSATRDHAGLVLAAAADSPRVPVVRLLTRVPVYDGQWNLAEPGLNADGVYYDQGPALRDVCPVMDRDEIRRTFDDLVVDFPFVSINGSDADRQNVFALLLTTVVRWAYPGNTPLGMIWSPLERTGKSKLASVVLGGIALGSPAPSMPLVAGDEELEKRITACLLRGHTTAIFDNLSKHLDSPSLATLLTSRIWEGRILGASAMVKLPNTLSLLATANNPTLSSEMAKRCVPIGLQPASDQPENRDDFQHPDLESYVRERRPHVISCLLGAVELWKGRGRPAGAFRFGGFEGWAGAVGGILGVLGYDQFMANYHPWLQRANPEGADKLTFVQAWWTQHGTRPVTASQLVSVAEGSGVYAEFTSNPTRQGAATSLGRRVLQKLLDQPVGRFIVRDVMSGSNRLYWLELSP